MAQESVKVMVRVRHLINLEQGCRQCLVVEDGNSLSIQSGELTKQFIFDQVCSAEVSQEEVYESSAFGLVESTLSGYNATMLTYGQTGSGKTYTMIGGQGDQRGVVPRAFEHLMDVIGNSERRFLVRCSYIQIYNDEIRDLLESKIEKLEIRESVDGGVFVKGLSQRVVRCKEELMEWMSVGNGRRVVCKTGMNDESSRSHVIFSLYVESEGVSILSGKLNLVDLAGSERQESTKAQGERLKEACKINLSLQALGNVISALVDGRCKHIPYRDSKLTRLLQDSLGGNTRTIMLATVSPADRNVSESISTLRYASRAKLIKNKPKVNEDPKDAMLREYADEIKRLKEQQEQEMPERVRLERLIKELQEKTVVVVAPIGGEKKYKQIRQRLKKKEDEHARLVEQKQQQEEELLSLEHNYQSVQEQVEGQKKLIRRLRVKCKSGMQEIEETYKLHEREKQQLLDMMREQQHQFNLMQSIVSVMLNQNQLEALKASVIFDHARTSYKCPPFLLKDNQIKFPKLPYQEAIDMIHIQQSQRSLLFTTTNSDSLLGVLPPPQQIITPPIKQRRPHKLQSIN